MGAMTLDGLNNAELDTDRTLNTVMRASTSLFPGSLTLETSMASVSFTRVESCIASSKAASRVQGEGAQSDLGKPQEHNHDQPNPGEDKAGGGIVTVCPGMGREIACLTLDLTATWALRP